MISYHTKPGTKVGDIVDYNYHGETYKAKVIKTGYYNYDKGTIGYVNGDKYFEAIIEFTSKIGCKMQMPLLNNL